MFTKRNLTCSFILLASLGLFVGWYNLGIEWYAKVLPFFDSMGYQETMVLAARAARQEGLYAALAMVWERQLTSPLHAMLLTLFAKWLPANRSVLYLYLLPCHLAAVSLLAFYVYRKTSSASLAIVAWGIYLTTAPFRELWGGVLDQRLDLATASFALFFWTPFLWWESCLTRKAALISGVAFGFCIANRPLFAVQGFLFVAFCVFFHLAGRLVARDKNQVGSSLKEYFVQLITMAASTTLVGGIVVFPKFLRYFQYYFQNNVDVFSGATFASSLRFNLDVVWSALGIYTSLVVVILLVIAICTRKVHWGGVLKVFIAALSGLLPLVFTRSVGNPLVPYAVLPSIALIPFAMPTLEKHKVGCLFSKLAMITIVFMVFFNVFSLSKAVSGLDVTDRRNTEESLQQILRHTTHRPLFISGFVPIVSAVISIGDIEMGQRIKLGYAPFHPTDFFITKQESETPEGREGAIKNAIDRIFGIGGMIMLIDPENPKLMEERNQFSTFADKLVPEINNQFLSSRRIRDTGIKLKIDRTVYRFFDILPAENR